MYYFWDFLHLFFKENLLSFSAIFPQNFSLSLSTISRHKKHRNYSPQNFYFFSLNYYFLRNKHTVNPHFGGSFSCRLFYQVLQSGRPHVDSQLIFMESQQWTGGSYQRVTRSVFLLGELQAVGWWGGEVFLGGEVFTEGR